MLSGHKIEDSPNVGDEIVTETANQEDDILENVNSEDSIQDSDNSKHSKRDRVGLKHSRQMSAVMEGSRRSSTTGSLLTEIQDVAEIVQQNENSMSTHTCLYIIHVIICYIIGGYLEICMRNVLKYACVH